MWLFLLATLVWILPKRLSSRFLISQRKLTRVLLKLSLLLSLLRRATKLAPLKLPCSLSLVSGPSRMVLLFSLSMTMVLCLVPRCLILPRMTLSRNLLLDYPWLLRWQWLYCIQPPWQQHLTCSSMPIRMFWLLLLSLNIHFLRLRK